MHRTARYRSGFLSAVLLAATVIGFGVFEAAASAEATTPKTLTVWVSPQGSDQNSGLSPQTPFATLQRANDWLCHSTSACRGRGRPVDVRIAQTTFHVTSTTTWRYFDSKFPTRLLPWSYKTNDTWLQLKKSGGLPTFDGNFTSDHALSFVPSHAGSASTGLRFIYLRWQRFNVSAIEVHGGVNTVAGPSGIVTAQAQPDAANGIVFYGDYFSQIGNRWHPERPMGWGAIDIYNSRNDLIVNNHFAELENSPADAGHVHALYLSHGSDNARVVGNYFTDISGDVVRERDGTIGTLVMGNVFSHAGQYAYVDDWFCRPTTPDAVCTPKEVESFHGRFYDNVLGGLYPEQVSPRVLAFCFDLPGGPCPQVRWNTVSPWSGRAPKLNLSDQY